MINNAFVEELSKNRVLLDDNDCLDIRCFDKFNNNLSLSLKYSKKRYGGIYVTIKGINGSFKVVYSNITLLNVGVDGEYFIPISFIDNEPLLFKGICESLMVKLYGCRFDCEDYSFLLPNNKFVVCGIYNKTVYEFENSIDLKNLNYSEINNFTNCIFVQTYILEGVSGIGKLYVDNGLKFSSSLDGFSEFLTITNDTVQSAIFLQDSGNGYIYFIYAKNNKVLYKVYDITLDTLSDEYEILLNILEVKYLVGSIINSSSEKFFGIVSNDRVSIYVIKSNVLIEKVFEGVGKNLRLFEYDNHLVVYLYKNDSVVSLNFLFDVNNSASNILTSVSSRVFQNVADVLEYNNMYIYTSNSGSKELLSIDE